MTLNEYQKLAARTINNDLEPKDQVRHALFGLAAETGEIMGLYQKQYQGHELTINRLIDEGGDALWMLAELFTAHGVSLEEVAQHNVDKLRKRYPEGFDPDKSLHRGGENDNG